MNNYRSLVKSIAYLFSSVLALTIIIFSGLYLYNSSPHLFIKEKISALDWQPAVDWQPKDIDAEVNSGYMNPQIKYGYLLIAETPKYMGPNAKDSSMQFAGNNLACMNCHLKAGTKAGSGSWVGVTERFPQFRGRSNSIGTIEGRINGCMERSMNGKKLPIDSKEMNAIVAYMKWLGEGLPPEREKEFKGYVKINLPEVAVDLEKGMCCMSWRKWAGSKTCRFF